MNGIEKITARIRADAEAECAAIRAESEERCAAIRAENERAAQEEYWRLVSEGVKDPACLAMTTESLTREFPLYTPSLLNLVKTSETHVKGLSPQE